MTPKECLECALRALNSGEFTKAAGLAYSASAQLLRKGLEVKDEHLPLFDETFRMKKELTL